MLGNITVVADDLTGACEIAGVGHRLGLSSAVTLDDQLPTRDAQLRVFDSETRLSPPHLAGPALRSIGESIAQGPATLVFKKTDSVLRGPVRAEVEALAAALRLPRILLVPANPELGRVVRDGVYYVQGTPLHETGFATDPHHPARTSRVVELLGPSADLPSASANHHAVLPSRGLIIGDAASPDDLAAWAQHVPADALAAGSSAFFGAWLSQRIQPALEGKRGASPAPDGPVLLISGTTFGPQRERARRGGFACCLPLDRLHDTECCSREVVARLKTHASAIVCVDGPVQPGAETAGNICAALAQVAELAFRSGSVRHLVIEGGATAAAVARQLAWLHLDCVHEWAPGIVSLRPLSEPSALLTVKPGSYPWPASIERLIFSPAPLS